MPIIENNQRTANRGEWSEFYALIKILSDRKIFSADEKLQIIPGSMVPVLKVIRDENEEGIKSYDIAGDKILLFTDGRKTGEADYTKIKSGVKDIFNKILRGKSSFVITEADQLMDILNCKKVKASSSDKIDIRLVIHDAVIASNQELGFSIKSMLGSPATLLNASGATNFVYEIDNCKLTDQINSVEGNTRLRDRSELIYGCGGDMIYRYMDNITFRENLRKVDLLFPEMLAELLKYYYKTGKGGLPELVDEVCLSSELVAKYDISREILTHKLKQFLVFVALGMQPSKVWNGRTENGGYIIVREDGEIVCYHLYNRDEFEDYLFLNVKFETPSSSRHRFGTTYKEEETSFMKLNIQLRFIS